MPRPIFVPCDRDSWLAMKSRVRLRKRRAGSMARPDPWMRYLDNWYR